jgi:D-amino peptidase
MVRVYLSVDMEGVAGISHIRPTTRGDVGYDKAAELMLGEANAAIEGAFAGGATELTLNDSHGQMYNLPPDLIDPRARYVLGTKPYSMVEAARDAKFDVALFVGYHARAGDPRGVIGHTYTMRLTRVEVNGRPITEAGMNGLYLGALGVPVAMVSGDDALAAELADWLPWAELVVVKRAVSYQSADSLHPTAARQAIRDAAQWAVAKAAGPSTELKPLVLEAPLRLRMDFTHSGQADMAAVVPGFAREGDRSVVYSATDGVDLFRAFMTAARVSRVADD